MSVAQSPTPTVGHLKHVSTTSGPMQIDSKHANLVNYAICIATVLFGITLIAAFALIIKWRKRTSTSLPNGNANAVVRNSNTSYLSPDRRSMIPKFPPPGLSYHENSLSPLAFPPATPPPAYAASHSLSPCNCQSCAFGPSSSRPCRCPACVNTMYSTIPRRSSANYNTGSDSSPTNTPSSGCSPTLKTPKFSRFAGVISALRSYPAFAANRSPKTPGQDENAVRRSLQRTPPTHTGNVGGNVWSPREFPLATQSQGRAAGDDTANFSASSASSTLTSSSSPFTASPSGTSAASPVLQQLSGDEDAVASHRDEHSNTSSRSSLDLAVPRDHLAHILVSPPTQDHLETLPDGTSNGEPVAPTVDSSSEIARDLVSGSGLSPMKACEIIEGGHVDTDGPSSEASTATLRLERWFTEVDWFGEEGPLSEIDEHAPARASL